MSDTPKYTVKEIDAFQDFEPYYCGENQKAIPDALYFLNTDGNGYQKYDQNFVPLAIDVVPNKGVADNCFTINGSPIIGCKKGSVVKAGTDTTHTIECMGSKRTAINIWREKNGDKWVGKFKRDDDNTTYTIDVENISRLGILLVGGGGAGGSCVEKYTNCDGCNDDFWITLPGAGGGGGGCIWCIIKLDKSTGSNNYFRIEPGQGGQSPGNNGSATILYYQPASGNKKPLLAAGGGLGGRSGAMDGVTNSGAGAWARYSGWDSYLYYNEINWLKNGTEGPGYSNDATRTASSLSIAVSFMTDTVGSYTKSVSNPELLGYGSKQAVMDAKGKAYLAVPGGNSWGHGGKCNSDGQFVRIQPTYGGGGMCYGNQADPINRLIVSWSSYANDNKYDYNSKYHDFWDVAIPCIRGADGYWELFY